MVTIKNQQRNDQKSEPKNDSKIDDQIDELVSSGENKYLIFYLGEEMYGTPLTSVREVIEYHEPKPVPNMVGYFEGVINVRGEIIGVVDLRKRFGIKSERKCESKLIFDTARGPLAAKVDHVEDVATIRADNIEKNPNLKQDVPAEYFIGIGRAEGQLVNLIQLDQLFTEEELVRPQWGAPS